MKNKEVQQKCEGDSIVSDREIFVFREKEHIQAPVYNKFPRHGHGWRCDFSTRIALNFSL